MSLKTVIVPKAKQELRDAFNWYENQTKGLGEEFLVAANTAKLAAEREPEIYPKVFKDIRKATIQRFPFCLYYVIRSETLYVLSVFHARRNPDEWKRRTTDPL